MKILDADEVQINNWLAENPSSKIVDIKPFNYGTGGTGVLIIYEERGRRSAGAV